jgi:hypothetical protein
VRHKSWSYCETPLLSVQCLHSPSRSRTWTPGDPVTRTYSSSSEPLGRPTGIILADCISLYSIVALLTCCLRHMPLYRPSRKNHIVHKCLLLACQGRPKTGHNHCFPRRRLVLVLPTTQGVALVHTLSVVSESVPISQRFTHLLTLR